MNTYSHNEMHSQRQLNASTLLAICLVLPCVVGAEINSLVVSFGLLFLPTITKEFHPRRLTYVLTPLAFIFVLGMRGFTINAPYDAFKDAWYVLKIVLLLATGYYLMYLVKNHLLLYRAIALSGAYAAIWHLSQVVIEFGPTKTMQDVRLSGIIGYFLTAIALALLLGSNRIYKRLGFSLACYLLLVSICATSLAISLSRTYIIGFLALFLILRIRNLRELSMLLVASVVVILISITMLDSPDESLSPANASLGDKLLNSLTEVMVSDYDDLASINDRWRGFEAYKALNTFLGTSTINQSIGGGFGALVDIGLVMNLNGAELQFLPMLHNGYLYVLVKYGMVGIVFYAILFRRLWRTEFNGTSNMAEYLFFRRFSRGLIVVTLLSTFVITGIFNKEILDSIIFLLGTMLFYGHLSPARRVPDFGDGRYLASQQRQ